MTNPLYQLLASKVVARLNCIGSGNAEWERRHKEAADALVREHLPSGSGFDRGTKLDWDRSTAEKLVLQTSFHHMDDNGHYDGWTDHDITVTGSLLHGMALKVSGYNIRDIKPYIYETFENALRHAPAEKKVAQS